MNLNSFFGALAPRKFADRARKKESKLCLKTVIIPLVSIFLSGCASLDAPLSTIVSLPENQFKISSQAPLNSTTGSTAFMEAEASRRCDGPYEVLSKTIVKSDLNSSADSVELVIQCYQKIDSESTEGDSSSELVTNVAKGNEIVRLAQISLNEFGYNAGRADGILGVTTKHALELFQSDSSLQVTGRLDQMTQKALRIL